METIYKEINNMGVEELTFMQKNIGTKITVKGVVLDRGVFSSLNFYQLKSIDVSNPDEVLGLIRPLLKIAVKNKIKRYFFKLRLKPKHYVGIYFWMIANIEFINRVERVKLKALKVSGSESVDYSDLDELGALPFILTIAEKYTPLEKAMEMKYYEVFSILRYLTVVANKEVEKVNKRKDEASRKKA